VLVQLTILSRQRAHILNIVCHDDYVSMFYDVDAYTLSLYMVVKYRFIDEVIVANTTQLLIYQH